MTAAFPRLDGAVGRGWSLLVCAQRYGTGVVAVLAPSALGAAWIEGHLTGGDNEAVSMQDYLGGLAGRRFPVSGLWEPDVGAALATLEGVLRSVAPDEEAVWSAAVAAAFEGLQDARDLHGELGFAKAAMDAGELHPVD